MPDINKAYSWAVNTCNAPNVGYSTTYRNQQTINGVTYYDCSSFINYALLAGGFLTPNYAPNNNAFVTTNMGAELLRLGFKTVPATGEILPGDIGVSPTHTEMCYKGGTGSATFMGAHSSKRPLADQVSISNYTSSFPVIYRYGEGGATGYGISPYVAAAICGNMWQESNINPGAWENLQEVPWTTLNRGFGLGQWTNTDGDTHGRLYKLHEWLSQNGYQDNDGNGQCAYIVVENVWFSRAEAASFKTLTDFLTSDSTDITLLTHAWNIGWEGIHDASWNYRVERAKQCYDYIVAHANDSTITAWYNPNNYLTDEQILNNAVMLFRYMSAGGGGGGTPGEAKKKKLPLWMMIKYHY